MEKENRNGRAKVVVWSYVLKSDLKRVSNTVFKITQNSVMTPLQMLARPHLDICPQFWSLTLKKPSQRRLKREMKTMGFKVQDGLTHNAKSMMLAKEMN